jgi:hypothetical protein
MAWTLVNAGAGITLSFEPQAGDVKFEEPVTVGIHYALRGTAPYVRQGVAQVGRIDTPPWVLNPAGLATFRALLALGGAMTLTTDVGETFTVKFAGTPDVVLEDTPARGTSDARYLVTAPLVRVA